MYLSSPCFWILILSPAITIAVQADPPGNLTELFASLSPCARECIGNGFSSVDNCTQTDPQCLCTSPDLQASISDCAQMKCTVAEQVPLNNAYEVVCQEPLGQSRGNDLYLANIILAVLVLPAIGLRCYSRYIIARELWWDDWAIVIAGLALVGMVSTDFLDVHYGFGRHMAEVPLEDLSPLLQIYLVDEVLYIVVLNATKVSVLLFYHRVFQRPLFHKIVSWNVWFVVLTGAAFVFVMIFQCDPPSGFWDKTIPSKCIDTKTVVYIMSGFSIVQDLLVLFLPIPELATLQMSRKKKWSVMVMFSIGGLACVTSIIRLKYLVTFGSTEDPSWDNVTPSLWSLIELGVAIICACLPAIRALANHYLPSLFNLSDGPNSRRTSKSIDKGTPSYRASRSVSRGATYSHDEGQPRIEENYDDDVSDFRLAQGEDVEVGKIHVNTTINIKVSDASALKPPAPTESRDPSEYSLEFHRPRIHGRISNEPLLHSATAIPLRRV